MDERTSARRAELVAFIAAHPIRGGDGAGPIFPEIPADLTTLSDEELQTLLDQCVALAEQIRDGDGEVVSGLNDAEVIDEMTRGVEGIEAIRGEQTARGEAAAAHQQALDDLAGRVLEDPAASDEPPPPAEPGDGDDAPEPATPDDEPAAPQPSAPADEAVPEPIAASARTSRRAPARSARATPQRRDEGIELSITASGDIPGFRAGQTLDGMLPIAQAMVARRRTFGPMPEGASESVPIATLRRRYPEGRTLTRDNQGINDERIQAVVGRQALVAAGGLCAPVTPLYDMPVFGVQDRPVRDSLPSFNATRGGIIYQTPPLFSEITTGVGIITAAQDAAGGAGATKTCQVVSCPPTTEVDVNIIYRCIQFANLTSRTHPERVAQFTEHVMIAHAQIAEVKLLDQIKAASILVTAANPGDGGTPAHQLGSIGTWLGQVAVAAAGYRNRHRLDPETRLRLLAPAWILDSLQVDSFRRAFQGPQSDQDLTTAIRSIGVEPTWYLDGPTGDGQMWPAQAAGALLGFPATVSWFLFAEGTFLFLDGGELDLGLVRDSTLNRTNNYQVFGESFENVAKVGGVESLNVVSAVCANGATGGTVQLACPAV